MELNKTLYEGLQIEITKMLETASNYTNLLTLRLRLLETIACYYLRIPMSMVGEILKNVKVHPAIMMQLEKIFFEKDAMDVIMSIAGRVYHKKSDLIRCVDAMYKKQPQELRQILAIDGFRGDSPSAYLENLAISNEEVHLTYKILHVLAVRKLYDQLFQSSQEDVTALSIRSILEVAFSGEEGGPLVDLYRELVGTNLELIAKWRQTSTEKKVSNKRKRPSSENADKKDAKKTTKTKTNTVVLEEPKVVGIEKKKKKRPAKLVESVAKEPESDNESVVSSSSSSSSSGSHSQDSITIGHDSSGGSICKL